MSIATVVSFYTRSGEGPPTITAFFMISLWIADSHHLHDLRDCHLFVLTINLFRGYPLLSLGAALLIALGLYGFWVKSGRPRGVSKAQVKAEEG